MLRVPLLLFILFFQCTIAVYSAEKISLESLIPEMTAAIEQTGIISTKNHCPNCSTYPFKVHELGTLQSFNNLQTFKVSILSLEEVESVFNNLKKNSDIPFDFTWDGCYARAHKMATLLDAQRILSGKAFIEGDLHVDSNNQDIHWQYHVAPLVLVKSGETVIPYVIDPSLFNHPVPFEEWKKKITMKETSHIVLDYFTPRFAYDPEDKDKKLGDYRDVDLEDMDEQNLKYKTAMNWYNNLKGIKK